jgi:hypothetical protein
VIDNVIVIVRAKLMDSFGAIDSWFAEKPTLFAYKPENNGWNIAQILEHISLTNSFLLILIRKGAIKAIAKAGKTEYSALLSNYQPNWEKLDAVGRHQSFVWNRPTHMEPTGFVALNDIKGTLQAQLAECLHWLEQLKNGEGLLSTTTMSVNGLGKIDVYQYIYFLAQHAARHLEQMNKVKYEFEHNH